MRRAAVRVLLLTAVLAADDGPAAAQSAGVRESSAPAVAGDETVRPHGAGLSERARDPFVDPFRRKQQAAATARPRGRAGIAVGELALRGLVLTGGAYLAVLESDRGRILLLRGGETLFDGYVRSVTAAGVTFVLHDAGDAGDATGRTLRLMLGAAADEER